MNEEQQGTKAGQERTGDSWEEVGQQFKSLGESLAQALRTAWEDERNRKRVEEMRQGLEEMVNEVAEAIRETADSPKGQKIREDLDQVGEKMRTASEETIREVRPHLMRALQRVDEELQKIIRSTESEGGEGRPPEDRSA